MATSHLVIEGLTCRYGERVAVDNLSFSVARGEVFGLLGPNGAGKSTVFHALSGLIRPDAGRMSLGGALFTPDRPAGRRRLGVVFQDPSLDEQLTGRENLLLLAALYGLGHYEARERAAEALELVGLTDRQHEPVRRYSGGMKRRLELGRVLLHRPELLIMDEPSRGLDTPSRRRYWEQLLALRRAWGMTILLTTHDPEEAEHCGRIAVLHEGRLLCCDTPDALRGQVGGDVLSIEAEETAALGELLRSRFPGVQVVRGGAGDLLLCAQRAHDLIPRLVEALPPGRLRSVSMRRPSLGDVFVKLAGQGLSSSAGPGEPAAEERD
jgi:ABC-2 type transport system ATP-binding protein